MGRFNKATSAAGIQALAQLLSIFFPESGALITAAAAALTPLAVWAMPNNS